MAGKSAPVVVHRWFPEGEGWAHDPSVGAADLMRIIQLFDHELKQSGDAQFASRWPGGWLVGERRADPGTRNRLAEHRSPTVFRVALLRKKPSEADEAAVRRRLGQLLPAASGAQPLRVELPAPPVWLAEPRAIAAAVVLAAAAAALAAAALANVLPDRWAPAAALLAAALVACAAGVTRWTGPTGLATPPEELARRLEHDWRQARAGRDDEHLGRMLSANRVGLQPDGSLLFPPHPAVSRRPPVAGGDDDLLTAVREGRTLVVIRRADPSGSGSAPGSVTVQVYTLQSSWLPWRSGRWQRVLSSPAEEEQSPGPRRQSC